MDIRAWITISIVAYLLIGLFGVGFMRGLDGDDVEGLDGADLLLVATMWLPIIMVAIAMTVAMLPAKIGEWAGKLFTSKK